MQYYHVQRGHSPYFTRAVEVWVVSVDEGEPLFTSYYSLSFVRDWVGWPIFRRCPTGFSLGGTSVVYDSRSR